MDPNKKHINRGESCCLLRRGLPQHSQDLQRNPQGCRQQRSLQTPQPTPFGEEALGIRTVREDHGKVSAKQQPRGSLHQRFGSILPSQPHNDRTLSSHNCSGFGTERGNVHPCGSASVQWYHRTGGALFHGTTAVDACWKNIKTSLHGINVVVRRRYVRNIQMMNPPFTTWTTPAPAAFPTSV